MRKSVTMAATLGLALALAGCSREEGAVAENSSSVDTAAAANEIRAAEAQWNRDYAARDVEAIAAHFADDATMAGPGSAPLSGRPAIASAVRDMTADPAFRLEFAPDRVEVAASGDLGFTRGRFALTSTNSRTGGPGTMRGTYLTVWRKAGDGRWRATEDMVTPGP